MRPDADSTRHRVNWLPGPLPSVSTYYNAGHPGVESRTNHIVLWHVPESQATLM